MLRSFAIPGGAILACLLLLPSPRARAADPDFLWNRLSQQCLPRYLADHDPGPCARVDPERGYALYKVDGDRYQYLLLPTARVTGIEDARLQAPDVPDYFQFAWQARALVRERLGRPLPDTDVALTVNAENARSQNQLHIHISCLAPAVRAALGRLDAAWLGDGWFTLPEPLAGRRYEARKLSAAQLAATNLFALVGEHVAAGQRQLAYTGIALVNLAPDTFLVLEATGGFWRGVPAEEIQDHACRIAQ
ncbi:CDP-diacylglycerol diphosphatase [Burkholderia perseverans]|uniref:CDP-diacylglycerol pyrophosphatase n=1 Tax=Burkholderia perseverans TaxID=2615214 RepID=UPI001FEF033A|nr:CDP-diacylglycerol diphosphatase [Burkholderia perseverans]